jgi:hypothetical protein
LQAGLAGTLPPLSESSDTNGKGKGKGKGKQVALALEERVQNLSKTQIEAEIKELGELKQDLALKVRLFPCLRFPIPAPSRFLPPSRENTDQNSAIDRSGGRVEVGA